MLGLIFVLLTTIAAPIGAQVTLTYDYLNPGLDVRCAAVVDIHKPLALSLSRSEKGTDILMVSMAFTPGASPVIHDSRGAQVTGGVSASGTPELYIHLHWPVAISSLEGEYKCSLAGLDNQYQVVRSVVSKSVTLTGLQPELSASVQEIKVGVTQDFSVRCSVADLAANNVSQIESVNLFYVTDDDYDLLASVTLFSPAQAILPGQNEVVVSGSVNGPEPYLEISWEHPNHSHAGQYTCDILALDLACTPVHLNRTINVTAIDSTKEELMARILNIETDLSNVEADLSHLNSSYQNTSRELLNTRQELTEIRQEFEIFKSPASCEEVNLTTGQQIVQLILDYRPVNLIKVICELNKDGQVWTVFQKRFDQSVDFNRNYSEYENGFGSLEGEFWLGLKNIVRLMRSRPCELRLDMVLNGQNYSRTYTTFGLDPEDYTLRAAGYDDDGEALSYNSGHAFYTYDQDTSDGCAAERGGGWWYDHCSYVNLNGETSVLKGFTWYELESMYKTLSMSEMKFRQK